MFRFVLVAVAATVSFAAHRVSADELHPAAGRSITMGTINGMAYYTVEPDGDRLVATFVDSLGGSPVRVTVTLASGQTLSLSVPHGPGEPASEVVFRRQGDRVMVDDGLVAALD